MCRFVLKMTRSLFLVSCPEINCCIFVKLLKFYSCGFRCCWKHKRREGRAFSLFILGMNKSSKCNTLFKYSIRFPNFDKFSVSHLNRKRKKKNNDLPGATLEDLPCSLFQGFWALKGISFVLNLFFFFLLKLSWIYQA